MQLLDRLLRIPAPFHPDAVEAVALSMSALDDHEWRSIFDHDRVSADERFESDAAVLMNTRVRTNVRTIGNFDVPRESRCVCHDDFAADLAVMCDVGLSHEEIVVADPGHSAATRCAAVDSDKLADLISLSDLGRSRFASILQVLRRQADRYEGKDVCLFTDDGGAV